MHSFTSLEAYPHKGTPVSQHPGGKTATWTCFSSCRPNHCLSLGSFQTVLPCCYWVLHYTHPCLFSRSHHNCWYGQQIFISHQQGLASFPIASRHSKYAFHTDQGQASFSIPGRYSRFAFSHGGGTGFPLFCPLPIPPPYGRFSWMGPVHSRRDRSV